MKPTRNSSFELLRIFLIIMIMVGHGNIWFIGTKYTSESEHLVKSIIETVCICAVDGFVLISGWFSISSKLSKIGDLVFMILFCTIPVLVLAIFGNSLVLSDIESTEGFYTFLLGGDNYWFVIDYIGLLIIAPILNKWIEFSEPKKIKTLLIAGYFLIGLYDFLLRTNVLGSEGGYSVLWFGYLYILARYLRLYGHLFFYKYRWYLLIFSITIQSILFYRGYIGLRYTNPFILLEAICFLFIFSKWNFYNRFINYTAKSALMAYLLHMQPIFIPYISHFLYSQYLTVGYWLYLIEIFILSILALIIAVPINVLQSKVYKYLKSKLTT